MENIIKSSFIISFMMKVIKALIKYCDNSKICEYIKKISKLLHKAAIESKINRFFSEEGRDERFWKNSFLYRIISYPFILIFRLSNKNNVLIRNVFENGLVVKYLKVFIGKIGNINMRNIVIFMVIALVPFIPTMALLGLILFSIVLFCIYSLKDKSFSIKGTPIDMFVLLFAFMVLYGGIVSFAPQSSISISITYILYILFYFVCVNTIKTTKILKKAVLMLVIAGFFVALYGIYQYVAGGPTTMSWIDEEMFDDITRIYSTFENPNVLGEYLVLLIPLSMAFLWTRKDLLSRILFGVITIVMIVALIMTQSRGSWLGFMLALLIFFLLRDRRFLVAGAFGALTLPVLLPTSVISRFSSIGNLQDTSTAYRFSIWLGSLKIVKDFWPSGIGLGSEAFSRVYPRYALSGAAYALHAHNTYIQLIVEIGIIGLIAFIVMLIMYYRKVLSTYYKAQDYFVSTLMISLCSGLTGYLFQGLVDNIWYNYRVVFIFWVFISLGIISHNIVKRENEGLNT